MDSLSLVSYILIKFYKKKVSQNISSLLHFLPNLDKEFPIKFGQIYQGKVEVSKEHGIFYVSRKKRSFIDSMCKTKM